MGSRVPYSVPDAPDHPRRWGHHPPISESLNEGKRLFPERSAWYRTGMNSFRENGRIDRAGIRSWVSRQGPRTVHWNSFSRSEARLGLETRDPETLRFFIAES